MRRFVLFLALALAVAFAAGVPLGAALGQGMACIEAPLPAVAEALARDFGEAPVEARETPHGALVLFRNAESGTWTVVLWPAEAGGRVACAAGSGDRSDDPLSLARPARPS